MRFFNTSGPIIAEDHYHVPPLSRLDVDEVMHLIGRKRYFVLHAPRQTGKTTALGALQELLNDSGRYRCVYVNVEEAQTAREDVRRGLTVIADCLAMEAEYADDDSFPGDWRDIVRETPADRILRRVVARWAASDPKPLVLLIDEIDALIGDTLVAALRQLRTGYRDRPRRFPQSVVLCGVRDVRDYRIHASSERDPILGGSAFNIKAKSLRLGDFREPEVRDLLDQHTQETGQRFTDDAVDEVWRQTRGQPWLVNALAYEACFERAGVRDRGRKVGSNAIHAARERLILRRDTHLDQLVHKLEEPRVRRVIEPLLTGSPSADRVPPDDLQYVRDLGLVKRTDPVAVANPIYGEVIPRELTYVEQAMIPQDPSWYVGADGRLDMAGLLAAFQEFFRENSEHWVDRFQYREAGPQLLLQAFLQRVVNSGGRIEREYGVGRRRIDLAVIWPGRKRGRGNEPGRGDKHTRSAGGAGNRAGGGGATGPAREQRVVVECKVVWRGLDATVREGLPQTAAYMDMWSAEEGHLVVFDRTPDKPWEQKNFRREEEHEGRRIAVWGM